MEREIQVNQSAKPRAPMVTAIMASAKAKGENKNV
jgi:hypothetical protein